MLSSRKNDRELLKSPYFDSVLADAVEAGEHTVLSSAGELCKFALGKILAREFGKIGTGVINEADTWELLEAAAVENLDEAFGGVLVESLRADARTFSVQGMSQAEEDELVMRLVQLPVFVRSGASDRLLFSHEILSFYLLARSLAKSLAQRSDNFVTKMARQNLLPNALLLQLLGEEIKTKELDHSLLHLLNSLVYGSEIAFRNILQVAIYLKPGTFPDNF